jgi:hypothetical protein
MTTYYDPYAGFGDGRTWHKAQFHMHNYTYDENGAPLHESMEGMEAFFREYRDADYSIVAHSTHNGWLDTSELDAKVGITSFGNEEYVDYDGILLVGASRVHRGSPQEVIDACAAEGGFAIICHPNQNPALNAAYDRIPPLLTREMSIPLTGALGVEIYNGCLARRQWSGVGFGLSLAVDYWDDALTSGRLLWGFATDDSHQGYEINVGWTEILASSTDFATIKAAAQAGVVVASRGMRLFDWSFDGELLEVEADLPYHRTYSAEYRFIGRDGAELARELGRRGRYRLRGDEPYVRVETRNDDGSVLWTQPLLRTDLFDIPA